MGVGLELKAQLEVALYTDLKNGSFCVSFYTSLLEEVVP